MEMPTLSPEIRIPGLEMHPSSAEIRNLSMEMPTLSPEKLNLKMEMQPLTSEIQNLSPEMLPLSLFKNGHYEKPA
jgi:hypothetical protein